MAAACVHVMKLDLKEYHRETEPMLSHINVGTGSDITIKELAEVIKMVVGFNGGITFDTSKPDGAPRKLMDSSRLNNLGWQPFITLKEGLSRAYADYLEKLRK